MYLQPTLRAAAVLALASSTAFASFGFLSSVPTANSRSGHPENRVAGGFVLRAEVTGDDPLENPSGLITNYGHLGDAASRPIEATKTEPDGNTYVVLDHNPGGPTPGYDYGRHFLFQGHENANDLAYVTRINLDVTARDHRITLLTPVGPDGKTHLNSLDGSVWDPFTETLLFTSEAGAGGGVVQITPDWPPVVTTLDGIVGKGGFEGIHPDAEGNLIIAEDVGGTSVNVDPANTASPKAARQPNSFLYRFVPDNPADLTQGGALQALQVTVSGVDVVFNASDPVGDTFSDLQVRLHAPGTSWPARWVPVHSNNLDGIAPFSANAAAKTALATPFKRPENFAYLPGSNFATFFFTATGDTSAVAGNVPGLAARGAWGSVFRVDFPNGNDADGSISIFIRGTAEQAAFDIITFGDARTLLVGEDRGDTLHRQLNRLDSIWAYTVGGPPNPRRFLAEGRDPAAQVDAAFLDAATPGFQNDGDNEVTGLTVSDGAATVAGLLGTRAPSPLAPIFFTQQHGQNNTFLIARGGL